MTDPVLTRYRQLLASQTRLAVAVAANAWDRLGTYNEADVERFAAMATPALTGAKTATVATAVAFYSSRLGVHGVAVGARQVTTAADLRSPFTATWHALAGGRPYEEAVAAGRSALQGETDRFLTSTARRTGDVFAAQAGINVSWERVAEPGCCDWCSDRDGGIYDSADQGDYGHDNCHCDVVPLG